MSVPFDFDPLFREPWPVFDVGNPVVLAQHIDVLAPAQ
jgi:hypothetical protein